MPRSVRAGARPEVRHALLARRRHRRARSTLARTPAASIAWRNSPDASSSVTAPIMPSTATIKTEVQSTANQVLTDNTLVNRMATVT